MKASLRASPSLPKHRDVHTYTDSHTWRDSHTWIDSHTWRDLHTSRDRDRQKRSGARERERERERARKGGGEQKRGGKKNSREKEFQPQGVKSTSGSLSRESRPLIATDATGNHLHLLQKNREISQRDRAGCVQSQSRVDNNNPCKRRSQR